MSPATVSASSRYLAAKKSLDDRSLNRHVWDALMQGIHGRQEYNRLRVLEVGCGIGTMLERLLDWGLLTRAAYTGIDIQAEFIREARRRLRSYVARKNAGMDSPSPNPLPPGEGEFAWTEPNDAPLILRNAVWDIRVNLEAVDLFDFMDRNQQKSCWDLLVAHAFLDLIDLPTALPRLLSLLVPGGLFYFTLNFDGATIFEPTIDTELDRRIETLYHQTMDMRRRGESSSGSSVTGRQLLRGLKEMGVRVAAAGSSDWVVFPGSEGYPGDEAYFLHYIIDTIGQALDGHPALDPHEFQAWVAQRHRQIDSRELIYVAHQLDILGYNEKRGVTS